MKKLSINLLFLVILILTGLMLSFLPGCRTVQPWEKEMLGDPVMQFPTDQKSSIYEQHMLNSREGSSGGYGGSGGGCGCK